MSTERSPYRLILLDCINTLLLPRPGGLPHVLVDGVEVPSTAPLLHKHLAQHFAVPPPETVHRAAREAWRWAESRRGEHLAEVPAPVRFRHLCGLLGLPEPEEALVEQLVNLHMDAITATFHLPSAHTALLRRLAAADYRVALFSNFDYAPALLRRLEATGCAAWFDPLIVSHGLGYRKPGPAAFERALALCGEPPEAVLLVGDSLQDDVGGATRAGLDVAWVNARGDPPPEGAPRPTYTLAALGDLAGLLRLP